jgi:hypothetical protein
MKADARGAFVKVRVALEEKRSLLLKPKLKGWSWSIFPGGGF